MGDRTSPGLSIVHVCRVGWPHYGGMESVVGGLAGALVEAGHTVKVVTLDEWAHTGERLPSGVWNGAVYARIPRVGPARYPGGRGLLSHLTRAQIVHVHGIDGLLHQVLATRRLHRACVALTPHGGFFHTRRQWALKRAWMLTGAGAAMRAADGVFYTSESSQAALAASGVEGEVICNGVDTDRFSVLRRAPEPGRWLALGRLDTHKGIDDLLRCLAAVARPETPSFHLRIVGAAAVSGIERRLRRLAKSLGVDDRVEFLGSATEEQMEAELMACEMAFFPSRYEAFGVGVVEAMAAGVPVVVNAIAAFESLVEDGVTGHVVDFQSTGAARQVRKLRIDGLDVGEAARVAAQTHSWRGKVTLWEAAYRRLVAVR